MDELVSALLLKDPALRDAAILFWAALGIGLLFMLPGKSSARQLRARVRTRTDNDIQTAQVSNLVLKVERLIEHFTRQAGQTDEVKQTLQLKLWRAGFYSASASIWWIIWRILALPFFGALATLFVLALGGDSWTHQQVIIFGAGIGAFLGSVIPLIYRRNCINKRTAELRKAWPDLLDMLALTVGAGLTLEKALIRIRDLIEQRCPALGREISMLAAELTYFGDRATALQNLGRRCGTIEADELVVALIQSQRKGLPLAAVLIATAREQRRKRRVEIEKKAAGLPAKLTVPMILFFLPALLTVILAPVVFRFGSVF